MFGAGKSYQILGKAGHFDWFWKFDRTAGRGLEKQDCLGESWTNGHINYMYTGESKKVHNIISIRNFRENIVVILGKINFSSLC